MKAPAEVVIGRGTWQATGKKTAIGYDNLFQDNLPFRSQLFERSRGVCGACRQGASRLVCPFSAGEICHRGARRCRRLQKNVRYLAFCQYFREVVRHGVLYRAVGRAAYLA